MLWFPAPSSYTGEDCAELHLHGGRGVLSAILRVLMGCRARPAEPGEFTRRAFINGKMDLTEAEGIADLVAAETEAQRRQALRQLQGELGALYRGWAARLLRLTAFYEAAIDFGEEDGALEGEEPARAELAQLRAEIVVHLEDGRRGERIREGLVFAIVGPPNVGKSSIINALASRDVAIVSPKAGTTRDVVEARLELGGVAVTLLDTAGLHDTDDPIEREGMRRARNRAGSADLVIVVGDGSMAACSSSAWPDAEAFEESRCMMVANKIDLAAGQDSDKLGVSARTGEGIDRLRDILREKALAMTSGGADAPLTRARHRAALQQVVDHLGAGYTAPLIELRAEDLRLAVAALGRITGRVGVEDVLDSVFSQFCIGK